METAVSSATGNQGRGRIAGKVAIVTGAGNGIGQATAVRFAAESAMVVCADIDRDRVERTVGTITAAGHKGLAFVGDITEEDVVERLVAAANEAFGKVDILVNIVGVTLPGRIWELKTETWDFVLRTNLRSMFLCTRAVAPQMMERRSGRIINLSSGARKGTPWQALYSGHTPYATTKAGVEGFTRNVSMELAEFNITVNAVAPGPIKTESTAQAHARWSDPNFKHSPLNLVPLGRAGTVDEIANAILFLASDESSYMTGAMLDVSGGR